MSTTNTSTGIAKADTPVATESEARFHPKRKPPPPSACPAPSSWPFRPQDTSPLAWWRAMPADHLGGAEHLVLREVIGKVGVLKGREWVSAMRGDAAASVAIALEMLPMAEITLEVDLAMSTLLLSALGGNAASALVLSHALRRAPLDHPFARELSVSWLVRNLQRAAKATKRTAKDSSRPKMPPEPEADVSPAGMVAS